MISFRRIVKLSVAAAAAFIITGCAGNDAPLASKGNMIPDNAIYAVKVNADQFWNKALGDQGSPGREMWQAAKSMASIYTSELGEFGEVARQILNDPAALGVNMKEPLVLTFAAEFSDYESYDMEGNVEVCLVALLDDSEAFLKIADAAVAVADAEAGVVVLKNVAQDFTHYEVEIEEDLTLDLGVTEESAVIRIKLDSAEEPLSLSDSMLALFAGEGPHDTDGIEAFYASEADLAMWGDLDATLTMAMPVLEQEDPDSAAQLQAYLSMYEGSSFVSDLDFQDGRTVLNYSLYGSKELETYAKQYYAKPSAKFFEKLPASPFFAINVALKDCAGLVDEMSKLDAEFAELFTDLEEEYGFEKELLEGFPGVITFALSGDGLSDGTPVFGLMMDCEENVWEYAQEQLAEYADADENGVYNIDDVVYVGYADGYMYAMDPETFHGQGSSSLADNAYADILAKGGLVVDLEALSTELLDDFAREIDYYLEGEDILQYVSSIVVDPSDDLMSGTLVFNMGDKGHNLLEKLVLTAVDSAFQD